ncbi:MULTISPECIES: WD40 repeat domain-containing serine/threonine protein kinase [Streptomyces]|uniref:WD40 repeat domain-containing serine/threonine protein kinase n=1 Tax=Streptomyces TaxID=1883 RepID=UPI000241B9FD|nr:MULTISPECIES: serine/threonine-protein kinase [Streptomyces]EHM23855.1 serine/threonine protein kinase [Streptomyces sp. W007]MCX4488063.1 protein kinase [Streptomyces anulatus]WTD24760.1 protein kinase [Streptomyces anulatus]
MDALRPDDPQWVGPYRLDGRLGEGGMGSVFLGTSPGGRKVAVKLIRRELSEAPQFRERFAREVDAARRVGGFHTAQVVDADPGAAAPWLVTAYIPGPTLHEVVAEGGPLDATAVLRLGAGLAEGLAAIHKCGLVHRDLKPGNVIIADDGPRVIDFGIARAVDASSLTATGTVIGTYSFMSPEQIRADRAGAASDVFSLGSVLAFAATGRGPFDAPTLIEIVQRILDEPPALDGIDDDALRELLAACMAKAPEARPAVDELPRRFATGAAAGGAGNAEARPVAAGPVDPRVPMSPAVVPAAVPSPQATHPPTVVAAPSTPPPGFGPASTTDGAGDSPRPGRLSRRTLLFGGLGTAAAAAAVGVPILLRDNDKADGPSEAGDKSGPAPGASKPAEPEEVIHLEGLEAAQVLAFSENGRKLYGADPDTIWRWNPSTGAGDPVHIGARMFRQAAVFSRDLALLVRAEENKVRIWDTTTGKTVHTFTLPAEKGNTQAGWPLDLAISADGRRLAASTGWDLHLWELPSGKHTAVTLSEPGGPVAFRGDGGMLVSGWNSLETLTPAGRSTGAVKDSNNADVVVFSPDGSLLAFGKGDGHIVLWNTETRSEVTRMKGWATALAFHPEGRLLISGAGTSVQVWDTVAGKEVGSYDCPNQVEAVAVSPDGKTVAIGLNMAVAPEAKDAVLLWRLP